MRGSKEVDKINNSDIFHTYNGLCLREKKLDERLLQGIQSANSLIAWTGTKMSKVCGKNSYDQGKYSPKKFRKRFAMPLDFDFFKHSVYPYGLNILCYLQLLKSTNFVRIVLNHF